MQPLWAPWRMDFIRSDPPNECVFCRRAQDQADESRRSDLVLAADASAFVILNRYPYNNGHLLVVPVRHVAELPALSAAELAAINRFLQQSVRALGAEYSPEGFNIGLNLGRAAGAGIAEHLHYHVVPRWTGDTNFMPVLGLAKSIPEHLQASFDRLAPHFA